MKPRKGVAVAYGSTVIAVALGCPGTAWADLTAVPSLTEVQSPVATVLQQICGPINTRTGLNVNSAQEQQLGVECRKMEHTSNALQGSGPTAFNLGLTNNGMRAAVQGAAPEEMNALARGSIDAAGKNPINGRLLALRSGGRGLTLAESTFTIQGKNFSAADLSPRGATGGGASADGGLGGKWGAFVNGSYNKGDRSATDREDAFDFSDVGITTGVDYRFSDSFVAGVAVSYAKTEIDFDNSLGDVESGNSGLSLYATRNFGGFYVDGFLSYAWLDFDSRRHIVIPSVTGTPGINATASASPEGKQMTLTLGAGYDIRKQNFSLTPYGRIDYLRLKIDGFTESEPVSSLGLDVEARTTKSVQTAIGGRISNTISTDFGVLSPYFAVEWNHEFDNDSSSVVAKYTHDPFNTFFTIPTDSPDRNFFTLSVGVAAVFPGGVSAFLNVDSVQGLSETNNTGVTVGVRGEF
ncbi:MAG TPA: autotransporter outer membrane beta-barrel domain-containing protein [Burkholderiales bacterium]|nr:autotransporter outer membrane beta-barrel domain-containing protein [Burkholderiales bacterium]